MIVKRRLLLDDSVNVGNGDKDLGGPSGNGFGNGKLVQITRIIVVDGAPEKVPEITSRFPSSRAGPWIPSSSASAWGGKIGDEPLSSIARWATSLQDRAVLSVVCVRHYVTFLECPDVIACFRNACSVHRHHSGNLRMNHASPLASGIT